MFNNLCFSQRRQFAVLDFLFTCFVPYFVLLLFSFALFVVWPK